MRRIGAWLDASELDEGPLLRRVGVHRRRGRPARPPQDYFSIPGQTRHWQERLQGKPAVPPLARYAIGWKSVATALRYVHKQSAKGGAVSRVMDESRR